MTKVLMGSNAAHVACEKLMAMSEKFGTTVQNIIELNGEFDSGLTEAFTEHVTLDQIKSSHNGASRILQFAAKATHESAYIRMVHANSFPGLGTVAKRDRLTMLTIIDLLKKREIVLKKYEQKRQDRGRKDLQYKTLKKNERFEEAQKLEQALEAIKNE